MASSSLSSNSRNMYAELCFRALVASGVICSSFARSRFLRSLNFLEAWKVRCFLFFHLDVVSVHSLFLSKSRATMQFKYAVSKAPSVWSSSTSERIITFACSLDGMFVLSRSKGCKFLHNTPICGRISCYLSC